MTSERPWRRACVWLAFLGPFFFASYGFANYLASRRAHVGSIVFGWEHSIPFIPWTIIPYWSIDVLYVVSIFLCTTKRELDRHALRLLFVQLVSVACFIAFPLRFTFPKPQTGGIAGTLFAALGSFDKPFNQAPSLHIALLILIWARLAAHTPVRWRVALHAWMTLIGVSILTTYQHHFIDLPTGLAVGLIALWIGEGELGVTRDRVRIRLATIYVIGASLFAALALPGGAFLWFLWVSVALLLVAFNYLFAGAHGFQKQSDGSLDPFAHVLFAPFTFGAWLNSRLWSFNARQPSLIADNVFLGRIPTRRADFDAIVDLCAEIPCRGRPKFYRSFPVLDHVVASDEIFRKGVAAIEEGRTHGRVLVCCALGFSRSASTVVAWMMTTGRAQSVGEAIERIRAARPRIVLKERHVTALKALVSTGSTGEGACAPTGAPVET